MDKGVDFTDASLTGAKLKAAGYQFCTRYLAPESWKRLSLSEAKEKTAHGIRIVSNFEDEARPADTEANGQQDATLALSQHKAYGGPSWAPIYFSVDSNVSPSEYKAYFRGVGKVLPVSRIGVYGEDALIVQLKKAGLITYGWRSMSTAFPGGSSTTDCQIKQTGSGHVAGVSVDFDDALAEHYGGWLIGEEDPMALTNSDIKLIWGKAPSGSDSPYDIITNPKQRSDSPGHNPPGTNVNAAVAYAIGDIWARVCDLQDSVAAVAAKSAPTAADLAAAVVAALPPAATGGITENDVVEAVKTAFEQAFPGSGE